MQLKGGRSNARCDEIEEKIFVLTCATELIDLPPHTSTGSNDVATSS